VHFISVAIVGACGCWCWVLSRHTIHRVEWSVCIVYALCVQLIAATVHATLAMPAMHTIPAMHAMHTMPALPAMQHIRTSGAIHPLVPHVVKAAPASSTTLDMPKSATLRLKPSSTKILCDLMSLCITCCVCGGGRGWGGRSGI